MDSGKRFLRSRVARRFFTLFVLAALIPITALTVLSYVLVRHQLSQGSQKEMQREAKSISLDLQSTLIGLDQDLLAFAELLAKQPISSTRPPKELASERLRSQAVALYVIDRQGRQQILWGQGVTPPAPDTPAIQHLAAGKSRLVTVTDPAGEPRILMQRRLDPRTADGGLLTAALSAKHLLDLEGVGDAIVWLLDGNRRVLFAMGAPPAPNDPRLKNMPPGKVSGTFDWTGEGGTHRASYRSLFLRARYLAPDWTVVLSESVAEVLAPIREFSLLFPPVIALSILLICLLSLSHIRKYLIPLDKLKFAVQRIAVQDFDRRVNIQSADEFQELGENINLMAVQLGKQFRLLATTAEIDRIILSSLDTRYIIETLLARMSDIVASDFVTIAHLASDSAPECLIHIKDNTAAAPAQTFPHILKAVEIERLQKSPAPSVMNRLTDADAPSYLKLCMSLGAKGFVRVPVVLKDKLAAVISLGYREAVSATEHDIEQLQSLAARAAVALSNAAWEGKLYYQAHFDSLTGLPNRLLFKDRLDQAIARAQRSKAQVAVMFIDLDKFKEINDSLGHNAGDRLLSQMSKELLECVRATDTVARLGGDEFTVLMPDLDDPDDVVSMATGIAERILEAAARPILLSHGEVSVSASIGIAVYPRDAQDTDGMLKNADAAMYHAKASGKNNYQFYAGEFNALALERLQLANHLRHVLERQELLLHYQPQVDILTGEMISAEVLVRWQHPEYGLIPPAKMIPIAEETHLITPIGEWVLRSACEQAMAWQGQGYGRLRVAVNLSARQFRDVDLVDRVGRALADSGLDPDCLELEITEGMAMTKIDEAIAAMKAIKAMGVRISIDDFGTGYSSLSYLKDLPIDAIKIDKSFMHNVDTDAGNAWIVDTIIALGHGLNLSVVAEGVETWDQVAFLRARRCDTAQGYLFSPPVSSTELERLLAHRNLELTHGIRHAAGLIS